MARGGADSDYEVEAFDEDVRCLISETPVSLLDLRWRYDDHGRVSSSMYSASDCLETEVGEERLIYGDGVVEAQSEYSNSEGPQSETWRYHVDTCGRVTRAEAAVPGHPDTLYFYDDRGRLVRREHGDSSRTWDYRASLAADTSSSQWTEAVAADGRTIWLTDRGLHPRQYEIQFDERQRLISIDSEDTSWKLTYGGCPNAEFATARWRFHDFLGYSWEFPAPALPGESHRDLDGWSHRQLPSHMRLD